MLKVCHMRNVIQNITSLGASHTHLLEFSSKLRPASSEISWKHSSSFLWLMERGATSFSFHHIVCHNFVVSPQPRPTPIVTFTCRKFTFIALSRAAHFPRKDHFEVKRFSLFALNYKCHFANDPHPISDKDWTENTTDEDTGKIVRLFTNTDRQEWGKKRTSHNGQRACLAQRRTGQKLVLRRSVTAGS